jgi:hypothetical protein
MTSVWSKITTLPGALGVKAAWGNFPTQFLVPIERLAAAIPCDRGQICQLRIVEYGPDDVVGICTDEDGLCGKRQVLKKERVNFRLDKGKLAGAIINCVGGKLAPLEELSSRPRLFRIGGIPTIGDAQLPVFFASAADIAATDDAMTALEAHGATTFLLVIPEEKSVGIVQQNRAAQRGGRIMGLDQLLDVAEKGVVSPRASGQETLKVWLVKSAPAPVRDAESARFPTPPGTMWKDVTITFMDRDMLAVKCGTQREQRKQREQIPGMTKTTTELNSPSVNWFLLLAFAVRGPAMSMSDLMKAFKGVKADALRQRKSELSLTLQEYFGIDDDPIPYDKRQRCYIPKFIVRQANNTDLDGGLESGRRERA